MPRLELFGTEACPFTAELREWLAFRRCTFEEYDVEADPDAFARMQSIVPGQPIVPVLIEDGKVRQIGWQGRSCTVGMGGW